MHAPQNHPSEHFAVCHSSLSGVLALNVALIRVRRALRLKNGGLEPNSPHLNLASTSLQLGEPGQTTLLFSSIKGGYSRQGVVAHAYNPTYLGGGDKEGCRLRPAWV
jgi:hypothetical protein